MGQIYLALDTRLGRQVALKFLPAELISDEISLLRLKQEACAASALNHPNILTIYDIGECEGEHFIASEFIDGVTLRSAMERNRVSTELAIDVATQVASALAAAHAAGVVHRDLKPTNIMLRPDGYVKVIDFGLAKRVRPSADQTQLQQSDLTRTGTTMGTAEYMSPEQARGDELDQRTDIWSLGVILYEMVAGQRPFEGETQSHVLVAILDRPVPPLPASKAISPGINVIISRALQKKAKDRYQSITDMLEALQVAAGTTGSGSRIRIAPARVGFSRRTKALIFAPILLALILVAAWFLWWSLRQPHWLRIEPVRQLTFNGRVQLEAISPDGKYLAYTVGQPDGEQALHLKQIDSPSDQVKIAPRKINYRGLTFAPDSQTLYVVEKDEKLMGRLYAVPLLASKIENPIVVDIDGPISFAPAGDEFVYVQHEDVKRKGGNATRSTLMQSSLDGQSKRALVSATDVLIFRHPVWSPDGRHIATFLLENRLDKSSKLFLDLVDSQGRESRRIAPDWEAVGQPQWTPDGKSLIAAGVLSYSEPNRRFQLHQLWLASGADHLLTNDLAAYSEVSRSADGKRTTVIKTDSKAAVWISRANDFSHGDSVPADAERDPALVWLDAAHVMANSRQNGSANLAVLDVQGQTMSPLTSEQAMEQGAAMIPGTAGKSVVFASNRSGEFHIWRFDADTNQLRQLTFGAHYDEDPTVSPDGHWVVYTSWTQSAPHLWKVPAEGGASVHIGDYRAEHAEISPDGSRIACYLQDPATGKWMVAIIPFDENGSPRMVPGASVPFRWSRDGESLTTVLTDAKGVSNLWRVPFTAGPPVQLTQFEDESISAFAWSPSGDRLACLRVTVGADVMLFKSAN
jgi:Tol biopolymer transport system component